MNYTIQTIVDGLFSFLPLLKRKLFKPEKYDEHNDLSQSHLHILFYLDNLGKMPISDIAKGLNISKSNMSPLIKKLFEHKFIERVKDENDKRFILVDISEIGKNLIDEHKKNVTNNLIIKLSKLDKTDLEKLSKSLHDIKQVISKLD